MLTQYDARLRVAKGATWLDKKYPGWENEVRLDTLDMQKATSCIIGNVLGDYYYLINKSDVNPVYLGKSEEWAQDRGFVVLTDLSGYSDPRGYSFLQEEWVSLIMIKRGEFI